MKIIYTVFALLVAVVANGQNPYLTLDYDSLVIYDYGDGFEKEGNIGKTGDVYYFKKTPAKKAKLTASEANVFSYKIGDKSSYGSVAAACFNPHFAALYYKNGKAIANIEICVGCNIAESSLKLTAQDQLPQKADDGTVYYLGYGMSNKFRKYLKELINKYKFSHEPVYNLD